MEQEQPVNRSLISVGIVCSILTTGLIAAAGESLPYYDVRLAPDGKPTAAVRAAAQPLQAAARREAKAAAVTTLQQRVAGVRVDDHEFFETPQFVASTRDFLTLPRAAGSWSATGVTRDFVTTYSTLFEIAPGELDAARIDRDYVSTHNGVTHLIFQQQIGGIDLFGCEVRSNVTRDGRLINISSTMIPRPAGDFQPAPFTLSALDAIRAAAESVGIKMSVDPAALAAPTGATAKQVWGATPDFRADEPITSEKVYYPLSRDDIRPAWAVLIPEIGVGNTYEITVDATSGQVLRRWNRLHYATTEPMTFRVYTSDSPAPGSPGTPTNSGAQFPFVPQQDVTINPGDISAINPDGWINDGVNETQGNNVDAHLDRDGTPNSPDLPRPSGTPYRQFLFTHDPAQAPTVATNQSAAVVQLFYLCNRYHDRLWAMGFNEAAKNFQTNNFGLGGVGNDRVQADAQDGSGTNNANFNTGGADGTTGRCQMYIFTGPTPDRDGDLDADVVYHELSHGLSIRLSNGTVNGEQSGGMGEGWGDFFGIALNAEPGDDPDAVYAMGAYATYQFSPWGAGYTTNYYFGIRRFPFSTDMNKNPQTYADIDPAQQSYPPAVPRNTSAGNTANEVHNVGEVWCATLNECRANLIHTYGFAGNQLMMQLVVDGMKLMAGNPNFLQARDGILQADLVNNGGANLGDLWAGFAKRGMGANATSPSGSTASGVVESFALPVLVNFEYPNGVPTQLDPAQPTTFQVVISGLAGTTVTPGSAQLHYSINGGAFTPVAMSETSANHYDATLPALNCFDQIRFYVSTGSSGGTVTDPPSAPTVSRLASVFTSTDTMYTDDVETDQGWSRGVGGDTATTGIWVRGDPNGTAAQPENAHSPTNCFFTGQGAVGGALGDADVDGGFTTLMTPQFNLLAPAEYRVSYWRWYSNTTGSNPNTDTFRVDISNNNGASWVNVETIGAAFGGEHDGGWFFHEFRPVDLLPLTEQMRIRFIAEDNPAGATGSLVEAAIDDFLVTRLNCEIPVVCTHGDVNDDGFVNGDDVVRFVQILLAGGGSPVENCAGDLGPPANAAIDTGDIDNFVTCVLGGGC